MKGTDIEKGISVLLQDMALMRRSLTKAYLQKSPPLPKRSNLVRIKPFNTWAFGGGQLNFKLWQYIEHKLFSESPIFKTAYLGSIKSFEELWRRYISSFL